LIFLRFGDSSDFPCRGLPTRAESFVELSDPNG
jgi:hypothetical protein